LWNDGETPYSVTVTFEGVNACPDKCALNQSFVLTQDEYNACLWVYSGSGTTVTWALHGDKTILGGTCTVDEAEGAFFDSDLPETCLTELYNLGLCGTGHYGYDGTGTVTW